MGMMCRAIRELQNRLSYHFRGKQSRRFVLDRNQPATAYDHEAP